MPEEGRAARTPRHRRAGRPESRRVASLRRGVGRRSAGAPGDQRPGILSDHQPGRPTPPPAHRGARRRLLDSLRHPGRGQLIAAAILFVVGLGGVMQIRMNAADDAYTNARREDLIQLLDGLGAQSRRLESEIADLEQTRTQLQSGADTQRVAREESLRRISQLSILAGTAPAKGPGIRMRIADPAGKVDASVLLDAVEEMRDAGAEVVEVNDSVRVVASTWFGGTAGRVTVDGTPVSAPLTLEVIGDPHSLEEAARFRGGIVSEITGPRIGGQVQIEQVPDIVVGSLHAVRQSQYARPASSPPTPR